MESTDFPMPAELQKPRAEMTAEEKAAHNRFCKERKKHAAGKKMAELGITPPEPKAPKEPKEPQFDEEGNLIEPVKHKPRSEMTLEEKQADNKARKVREKETRQKRMGEAVETGGGPPKKKGKKGETPELKLQLDAWVEAKRAKDFDLADAIRVELRGQGVEPEEYRPAGGGKGKGGGKGNMNNMMNQMMAMMGGGGGGKGKGGKGKGKGESGGNNNMMEQMMLMMMMNQMGGGKGDGW